MLQAIHELCLKQELLVQFVLLGSELLEGQGVLLQVAVALVPLLLQATGLLCLQLQLRTRSNHHIKPFLPEKLICVT